MARKKHIIQERNLQGFKYFKDLSGLLGHLRTAACQRDKAHNRILHMDQYMTLLLLCMFSPICSSLRAMQQASELPKVQKKLKVPRAALGSLSEAARVFDSQLLTDLIQELADEVVPNTRDPRLKDVNAIITLVDGTVLKALPTAVDTLWRQDQGAKAHFQYELLKGIPIEATVTDAITSEIAVLTERLQSGRLYVLDRGYAKYELMQDILNANSNFICRIKSHFHIATIKPNPLTDNARNAGVLRDEIVELGNHPKYKKLTCPVRLIELAYVEHSQKSVRLMRQRGGDKETMLLVTDRLDLPAEVIALLYHYRWQIEIFFRWFKHLLGCRHLLSSCENGIALQTYAAIIACLLIALYTGSKPTIRTYEMVCWYFAGWADNKDLLRHIAGLKKQD